MSPNPLQRKLLYKKTEIPFSMSNLKESVKRKTELRFVQSSSLCCVRSLYQTSGQVQHQHCFHMYIFRSGKDYSMYRLLTKCEVKNAKYPAILTKQPWSIKHLLYRKRNLFCCGTQWVSSSRQESTILPAGIANHRAGFGSSRPFTELAIF